jgi:hypothetical protein
MYDWKLLDLADASSQPPALTTVWVEFKDGQKREIFWLGDFNFTATPALSGVEDRTVVRWRLPGTGPLE